MKSIFARNELDQRCHVKESGLLGDVERNRIRRAGSAGVGQVAVGECECRELFVG